VCHAASTGQLSDPVLDVSINKDPLKSRMSEMDNLCRRDSTSVHVEKIEPPRAVPARDLAPGSFLLHCNVSFLGEWNLRQVRKAKISNTPPAHRNDTTQLGLRDDLKPQHIAQSNCALSSSTAATRSFPSGRAQRRRSTCGTPGRIYTEQMFSSLTKKQERILNFITNVWRRSQIYPSLREIQKHCGYRSVNAVWDHLAALERKKAIIRIRRKSRTYKLMHGSTADIVRVPLLGTVPAGLPDEAGSGYEETVLIDANACKIRPSAKLFALQVRGDSMNGAAIENNDIVVVERRPARDGEIVAALIDQEVTLKRLLIRGSKWILRAENARYADLTPNSGLCVQGVMVALLRSQPNAR
jgi:repressor LexA